MAIAVALGAASAASAGNGLVSTFGRGGVVRLGTGQIRGLAANESGVVAVGYSGPNMLVVRLSATGVRAAPILAGRGVANAVATQPDGKILVAGTTSVAGQGSQQLAGATNGAMVVKRFNADGSPDRTFGSGGTARSRGAVADAIALGPHGTIVVAGYDLGSDTTPRVAIARFRSNGRPDGAFGVAGFAEVDLGRYSQANAVAVQRDGKIVFGGDQRPDLRITNALIGRLSQSGQLDRSFGSGGVYFYYSHGGAAASFKGIAIDVAGRIVGGGGDVQGSGEHALFVRLSPRGTLDPGFGSSGVVTAPSTHDSSRSDIVSCCAKSIAIARHGEIVAAGDYMDGSLSHAALWALTSGGRLDPRVGSRGLLKLALHTTFGDEARAIAVAPDGSVYSGGDTLSFRLNRPPGSSAFVARYRALVR
jgi:uncharacterized delta-60 repeat protein